LGGIYTFLFLKAIEHDCRYDYAGKQDTAAPLQRPLEAMAPYFDIAEPLVRLPFAIQGFSALGE